MSIKFLTFGNIVRTTMMPVFGAMGVLTGDYIGELIDISINGAITTEVYSRWVSLVLCICTAFIGAILRLKWEQYEHEKHHNDALHLVD